MDRKRENYGREGERYIYIYIYIYIYKVRHGWKKRELCKTERQKESDNG